MDKLIYWIKQPSTQRGFVCLVGLLGYTISPEKWQEISLVGATFLSLIEIFRDEKPNG